MTRAWLKRLWQWRLFFPLTPLGMAVVATAFSVHRWLAAEQVDFVLHAASITALGLVTTAVLFVLLVALLLYLRLRAASDAPGDLDLESSVRATTGFRYPRFRVWPLVQIHLRWADPPQVEIDVQRSGAEHVEVCTPRLRGRRPTVRRLFVVADIFGLARFAVPRRSRRPVRIAPASVRLTGQVISHITGGDAISHPNGPAEGELLDMRRYAPGDPLRWVLWKVFARTRQLLVRMPEQAIMPSPSGVGYLVAGKDDEASASAARFFVEEGLLGDDFLFSADGGEDVVSTPAEALDKIIDSAEFRHRGGSGLSRFLDSVDERRRRSCVLFLPATVGPWLEHVERAAPRIPGAMVVLAVDDELTPAQRGVLSRALFAAPSGQQQRHVVQALPQLVRRLTAGGFTLRVIHRPSGQLIAAAQLEALAR